jgi:hypothetical protein
MENYSVSAPSVRRCQLRTGDRIAGTLLGLCVQRYDAFGDLVNDLEVSNQLRWSHYMWTRAKLAGDGSIDFSSIGCRLVRSAAMFLATNVRWPFRQGAPSNDDAERSIHGVITNKSSVVLRTPNIVVEVLLGHPDALDPYASAMRALDVVTRASRKEATEAETPDHGRARGFGQQGADRWNLAEAPPRPTRHRGRAGGRCHRERRAPRDAAGAVQPQPH